MSILQRTPADYRTTCASSGPFSPQLMNKSLSYLNLPPKQERAIHLSLAGNHGPQACRCWNASRPLCIQSQSRLVCTPKVRGWWSLQSYIVCKKKRDLILMSPVPTFFLPHLEIWHKYSNRMGIKEQTWWNTTLVLKCLRQECWHGSNFGRIVINISNVPRTLC